jgi:hypothetical protein
MMKKITDYLKISRKTLEEIFEPFPPHKVTIKAIWTRPRPDAALRYLLREYGDAVNLKVLKQRECSIVVEISCGEDLYQKIKLNFIKDIGNDFIWKD